MPLSGLLAEYGFDGGWPSIFYVFGVIGVLWSVAFIWLVYEDPSSHPKMDEKEKKYILSSLWGTANVTVCSINSVTRAANSVNFNVIQTVASSAI